MNSLKPNTQRARNAMLLIWLVMTMDIVSVWGDYLELGLLNRLESGSLNGINEAASNDFRQGIIGIVSFIVTIVSVVFYIMWFRRAYYNLHQKAENLYFTDGWAAGAWFVPVVNLFRPYRIMREMYEETNAIFSRDTRYEHQQKPLIWIGVWWTLWIASGIIGQISFRLALKANTFREIRLSTQLSLFAGLIGIPLAILAVKVIRDYHKSELILEDIETENKSPETNLFQTNNPEILE